MAAPNSAPILSADQIAFFKEHGYLVVPNVLSPQEVNTARAGLENTMKEQFGVDVNDLENTGIKCRSAHIAGGIIEMFYPAWKMKVMENERLYRIVSELWAHTWASGTEPHFEQPYGAFDATKGYAYVDRFNFRMPNRINEKLPTQNGQMFQKGLIPHVDINPYEMFTWRPTDPPKQVKTRFRPIQTFVALTPNDRPNCGGFECIPGFHREFREYFDGCGPDRVPRNPPSKEWHQLHEPHHPAIHNRMKKDILYPAGAAVLWDWRLPHCNAVANDADVIREVVYTGFLPDLPINRRYAAIQWQRYKAGLAPVDFSPMDQDGVSLPYPEKPDHYTLSALGEMLMGKHLPPVQLPETAEQRRQRAQNTLWWSAALAAAGSLLYWWTKRRN